MNEATRDSAKATMERMHAKYGKEASKVAADLLMSAALTSEVIMMNPILGVQLADVFSAMSSMLISKFENPDEFAEKVFACVKEIQKAGEDYVNNNERSEEMADNFINHIMEGSKK